jgi:hypothetical protein
VPLEKTVSSNPEIIMKSAFMILLASIALFSVSKASAEMKLSDCVIKLMSSPSCVNQINAISFCMSNDDNIVLADKAVKCVVSFGPGGFQDRDLPVCLDNWVSSSRPLDNRTLCN